MEKVFYQMISILYNKILLMRLKWWHYCQQQKCKIEENTHFLLESKIENMQSIKEKISFGKNNYIRGEILVYPQGGKIIVGDDCYIGEGTRIWSADQIKIGNRVLIAHNVDIHDCNDHPIDKDARHKHYKCIITYGHPREIETLASAPVFIEDDVWIGFNSSILKGVRIGEGSIIGAGSVVTKDVEAGVIVAGNPAIIIKRIG